MLPLFNPSNAVATFVQSTGKIFENHLNAHISIHRKEHKDFSKTI